MLLKKWDDLPKYMKTTDVKEYYDQLKKHTFSLVLKRCFDVIVSFLMLVVLSPVILILALCIKADSRGPVFYRQERITQNGAVFRIFKFRTMVVHADQIGALVTTKQDARITRVGNKIRNLRLDELPQLINVLLGQMSFVGTRPEVKKYVDEYSDEMLATLLLPAGVTSLASIEFKDEDALISECTDKGMTIDDAYVKVVLPKKMVYNLNYLKKMKFCYDIKLCFETVKAVLK